MSLHLDARASRGSFAVEASVDVEPGTTVALLGPNGSGKSTLVALLAGLLEPDAGSVVLDGVTIDDVAEGIHVPADRRSIGVAFQEGLLFPHVSALENVAFPLRARGVRRDEAAGRARQMLRRFGFPPTRERARPADLSGGEAQRVAIARALVHEPRLLLLDEPTSSLDVRARAELRPVIVDALGGAAGIRVLVTHDPVEAMTLAHHIVVLEDGVVTQRGTPGELRDTPRTPYVAELVGLNLYTGRLTRLEAGAGRLETPAGDLVVAWPTDVVNGLDAVLGLLRPIDVAVHITRPEGGSARNVLDGPVVSVSVEGDRARVRVASRPPVVAEVTLGSVDRLDLVRGRQVWATFKAVEIELRLPG